MGRGIHCCGNLSCLLRFEIETYSVFCKVWEMFCLVLRGESYPARIFCGSLPKPGKSPLETRLAVVIRKKSVPSLFLVELFSEVSWGLCGKIKLAGEIWVIQQNWLLSRGTQRQFLENICSEDDLRSRFFGTFVPKFIPCLPLVGFSNI